MTDREDVHSDAVRMTQPPDRTRPEKRNVTQDCLQPWRDSQEPSWRCGDITALVLYHSCRQIRCEAMLTEEKEPGLTPNKPDGGIHGNLTERNDLSLFDTRCF